MKVTLSLLVAMVAFAAASTTIEQWESFKRQHGKSYLSIEEEQFRMHIFSETLKAIEEHNAKYEAGLSPYFLEMNHFGDLLPEEVTEFGFNITAEMKELPSFSFTPPANVKIPESTDWRQSGAVTPVKSQGNCASCWAFSSTGAIEGQLFRKTGRLVSLSEQQLVDCTKFHFNYGCSGGTMNSAFNYLKRVEGLESEDSYPYEGRTRSCRYNKNDVVAGSKVKAYTNIKYFEDEALLAAVATVGPISIAVSAGNKHFLHYAGGVFNGDTCHTIAMNHGALLVGYGSDSGLDYWLIKNSWGPQWGENGYMRLTRFKKNACSISSMASFPILL